ncbi:hypothetical protein H257_19172 [Aphanomyces astaci]|uniref:Peptidase S33 tripeptidyl aminopeptidase-like C-terminal domain-containing protein n=1 Tax=Aphanomyces astaci TaxID=112090 RepID=W4FAZ0_APHAT|nr:hypothetical protein H257_19172 [Aphanomyces astaci]ETV63893.1 hypothetical protein H257_19172 [Aphanomyces astaci]|eukprot:XP_009846620.1 hypothetical protein H257_19172 [Aphanomyces astaci]
MMRLMCLAALFVVNVLLAVTSSVALASIPRNGWYGCPLSTFELKPPIGAYNPTAYSRFKEEKNRISRVFTQCAVFDMPFCHNDTSCTPAPGKTMPFFVKWMPASVEGSKKALIMLEGGPGWSSVSLEPFMDKLHRELSGTGNNQVYSNWDDDAKDVSQHFLDLCQKDTAVRGKLLGENATATLFKLYETLDANASACSAIFYDTLENKPSISLRQFFFKLLGHYDRRKYIPTFAARLERCNAQDKDVMTAILTENHPAEPSKVLDSEIIQDTIVFSEVWQVPTPSMEDIKQQFLASPMALNDPDKGRELLPLHGLQLVRVRAYFNKTAAIPIGVSVLGLTGNLDPLTPSKHARRHFNNMKGDNKKLVEFPVAVHGVIGNTPLSENHTDPHCGLLVVADFLLANGALDAINLTCMDKVQPLNFDIPDALALELFDLDGGAMHGKMHTPAQGAKDYKSNYRVVGLGLNALLKHREAKATRGKYAVYEDACTGIAS